MMGTDPRGEGGVASVIRGYFAAGLGARWPVVFVTSHRQGTAMAKLAAWAGAWLRLAWLIAARRCAVLHLHASSRVSFWRKWSFYLLARMGGVPVIWHIHGGEFERFYSAECGRWRRRMVRRALGGAFRVVVLSRQWALLMQQLVPRANVEVIPNFVSRGAVAHAVSRSPLTLLFMGRISQRKGIYDLLEALRRVAGAVPGARLAIAGSGETGEVLRRARQLGIADRIELLGWITGPAKRRALAQAGALVLPSYAEGLPMVLLEAMAQATPVVATPVGGVPDLVHDGKSGLLAPAGDVDALARALLRLLTEPGLAPRLGREGQRVVLSDFSEERVLARLGGIYALAGVSVQVTAMIQGDQRPYTTM
jgi:glycosyltransferase involved in cell wall biosynthesis